MRPMRHDASPYKPDSMCEARVIDKVKRPYHCHYCKTLVVITTNKVLYGKDFGSYPWIYYCPNCTASVGMHLGTGIPLGSLANKELKMARRDAKARFILYCQVAEIHRNQGYIDLAHLMGIPNGETHFGMFDLERCQLASDHLNDLLMGE